MALNQCEVTAERHQGFLSDLFAVSELVTDRAEGRGIHPGCLAKEIFYNARVSPGKDAVHTAHFGIEAVVSFVANRHRGVNTTWRGTDDLCNLRDFTIAADCLRIPNPRGFPGCDHLCIHVDACDAERAEKVALTAFIHADPRVQQFRLEVRFVSKLRLFQN